MEYSVIRRENALSTDLRCEKSVVVPTCLEHFLSHTFSINPTPCTSERSLKGNDSELPDINGSRESGLCCLQVLIG